MSDEPKKDNPTSEVQAPEVVTELSAAELEQVAGGSPQVVSSPSFVKVKTEYWTKSD
jgi:hypothetical protein